jgi:phenylpyruvate tautomerase PptA (4-oxalocrotonate tautomerase family)
MPVVTITLMEGYDDGVKQTMATRLTDAVRATIAPELDGITVNIHEVAAAGSMRGRQCLMLKRSCANSWPLWKRVSSKRPRL